jgi:hypothetical protein
MVIACALAWALGLGISAKSMGQIAVTAGTPTVTYDLGTDTAGAGALAGAPSWGSDSTDALIPANQFLLGVGNGFPILTNVAGAAALPGGPTNFAVTAGASASIASGSVGILAPAPAGSSAGATLTAGKLGAGAGVVWSAPTFAQSGAPGNANYTVSTSSGSLTISNTGLNAVAGRSLLLWGGSGFLPANSMGELGLTGTVSINGGAANPIGDGPILVGVHAGAGANVVAGTNDFVKAGSAPAAFVAQPVGAFTNSNGFFSPITNNAIDGEYLAEQNAVGGGINFAFWMLSSSALFNLNPGDTLDASVTATIIADPGADFMFNLSELPGADDSDDDGFDLGSPSVPEPTSTCLLILGGIGLLTRRHR